MRSAGVRRGVLLCLVLSLVAFPLPLVAGDLSPNQPTADPNPLPGVHFVHVASTDNISANYTMLHHPLLNDSDGAIFIVTQNYNPKNLSGTFNAEAIGVWYDVGIGRWGIFNQDASDMPEEAAFNIHIPVQDSTVFLHEATAANSTGDYTLIDNPLTNKNPGASVFVTQNWNPPGEVGIYNPHVVGAWYSPSDQKWAVFNQDGVRMPDGASFNILVASPDETVIVHVATPGNTYGNGTMIDDPRIYYNPNALLTVTQNRTPHEVYNPHPLGIGYFSGHWLIQNQDGWVVPENAAFNILIPPTDSAAFTHVATAGNSVSNSTMIDHPLLNGNPDAIALVTQNWNPGGGSDGVRNVHHTGLWFSTFAEKWSIFNQDGAAMPEGAAFNIYVPPIGANAFTHVATPDNIDHALTYLDHPETNGNPLGITLFTPNWNPRGLSGTYHDHATGIWYYDVEAKAAIANEDHADMPAGPAFNVIIPDENAIVFTHTATSANSSYNSTTLDHPLLNGNPFALVYATQYAGVLNDQEIGVWYDGDSDVWSIFNQDLWADMPEGAMFNVLVIPKYKVLLPLILR